MKNKLIITEEEFSRIKNLHKNYGYKSRLLNEAEYLNQDRPNDPFQYLKVEDGTTVKYYFKGIKGSSATKYPNWTEAKGDGLGKIKSEVKFKDTAETTSQLSSTTQSDATTAKTDEQLYTDYFNTELAKFNKNTVPAGKVTKLSDGTYGYVLDSGEYTLLSDGYSINKSGQKSSNTWTSTPMVKPTTTPTATTATPTTSTETPATTTPTATTPTATTATPTTSTETPASTTPTATAPEQEVL
jgi:hypothetical protein